MHDDLVNLGWTEEHLSRISGAVSEEAQRARVLAQALPVSGPEDPSTLSVPRYALDNKNANPSPPPAQRLTIDSEPDLPLATIAINVQLRSHEVADPSLTAARVMFRRAANYIARIEDALIVDGWDPGQAPPPSVAVIPPVYTVHVARKTSGLLSAVGAQQVPLPIPDGKALVSAVVKAIGLLEQAGQGGPYACVLGTDLFERSTDPTGNLVMPRDRILPFLQGPLLRSSALPADKGVVVALSGNPLEIVVASDISVRYLQTTLEPRYVFRVAERVALRIKESPAIAILSTK